MVAKPGGDRHDFLKNKSGVLVRALLKCGILSSLLFIAMNVYIPKFYPGYSSFSQTVSELSALNSPTRTLWMVWVIFYFSLVSGFGWGVRSTSQGDRRLKIAGRLLRAYTFIGLATYASTGSLRGGGGTFMDTLHIAFTMITVSLMMLIMGFGAAVFGKRFRIYSVVSILILILFGILTGLQSARMEANLPTPWMGVWERISIAGYMVWVVVFAVILLRRVKDTELVLGRDGGAVRTEVSEFTEFIILLN